MKSSRRHELQTNDLAETLNRFFATYGHFFKWGAVGVLAVALVIAVVAWIAHRRQVAAGKAWAEYLAAASSRLDIDRRQTLQDIAQVHHGTPAGVWAMISRADMNLTEGTELLYQNKEEAQKRINEAIEGYRQALDQVRDPFLRQRVQFALGQAHESLGQLKDAQAAYNAVLVQGESSALGQLAKERLESLQKDDIRRFYDWFVAYKAPVFRQDGAASGAGPLPDRPDFTVPPAVGVPSEQPTAPVGGASPTGGSVPTAEKPSGTESAPAATQGASQQEPPPTKSPSNTPPESDSNAPPETKSSETSSGARAPAPAGPESDSKS